MRSLRNYDQSSLWKRLDELSRTDAVDRAAVDHLKSSVRKIAEHASWISTQVCRFMPQYTMHEERHFLNVLGISEALLPDNVIARLTPLECALPILAAYTHDLGMALSQAEHDALLDESTEQGKHFASYRTRFDEELRQLDRWRKRIGSAVRIENTYGAVVRTADPTLAAQAQKRIDAIEGHILASYLRDTHTEDDQVHRLRRWLDLIKQETGDVHLFRYGNFDYQRTLALIGISHGRGAPWLRRQLIDGGPDDRFFQPVATGESANLAFPSLLLRLADVMDFDASRAPRILFKHFGIENDVSVLEWKKHQSIIGWTLHIDASGREQPRLRYSAECEHPVHEKAIRAFAEVIKAELTNVRVELDAQKRQIPADARDDYDLHLPTLHQDDLDIRAARDPLTDQPKYVYHDLQFRLDQDEIQQLLMGESLYGDPGLCIRELLQNALDALELRELRLKMKQKGEARESVDGEWLRPGWVREPDGREEELHVTLDWGTDEETGQQWLRVTDNGVGMTEEVIKNYFTQIGKSFYRSPEFNQERAAMKAAGEVVSPISIFGIGILSCFMIAYRMRVRTFSGNRNQDGYDVTIAGPGSLFWFCPGTRRTQGTEITLYLPSNLALIGDVAEVDRLRKYDGEAGMRDATYHSHSLARRIASMTGDEFQAWLSQPKRINPFEESATYFQWPRYPIVVQSGDSVRLDPNWHCSQDDMMADSDAGPGKARYGSGPIAWNTWDWRDPVTGSRVRLYIPRNRSSSKENLAALLQDSEQGSLHEFAATANDHLRGWRTKVFVNGVFVPESAILHFLFPFKPAVATKLWLDMRGPTAPRLTLDRLVILPPTDVSDWKSSIEGLCGRLQDAIGGQVRGDSRAVQNLLTLFACSHTFRMELQRGIGRPREFDLTRACERLLSAARQESPISFTAKYYSQDIDGIFDWDRLLGIEQSLVPLRDRELTIKLDQASVYGSGRGFLAALLQTSDDPALDLCASIAFLGFEEFHGQLRDPRSPTHLLQTGVRSFHSRFAEGFSVLAQSISASLLQEALRPELSSSWAPFGLFMLRGTAGNAHIRAPGITEFVFEDDGCTVQFADQQGKGPPDLIRKGYDLTFPMTAVPLGQLRRECARWRTDRWYRPLGVAPFLLPALHDVWPAHAEFLQKTFKVPRIYCLLPRFELWSKRFSDWNDADWHDPENLSALWDLSGHLTGTAGQVLWARGTHDILEMPKIGLPAPEFLESAKT